MDALEELLNIETEIEDVQDQIKFLLERQEKLHERQSELKFLLEAYKASGTGNSANENASRSSSLEDWSGSFEWDSQADDVRLNIFGIPSYRQNQKEVSYLFKFILFECNVSVSFSFEKSLHCL